MKNVLKVFDTLEELFEQHCGDDDTMSKDEFKVLVEEGLKDHNLEEKLDISDVDEVFASLDKNSDGQLTLAEFLRCIGLICAARRKRRGRLGRGKRGRGGKGGRGKKDNGSEDEEDDE
uniref:protein MRP-126-like n=1 Tax=Doryrhamphus excisus TaxID=161450 RepID=UPI0025AEC0E0|nr:protein MRP-126-like [Doryrhamphus excisus]